VNSIHRFRLSALKGIEHFSTFMGCIYYLRFNKYGYHRVTFFYFIKSVRLENWWLTQRYNTNSHIKTQFCYNLVIIRIFVLCQRWQRWSLCIRNGGHDNNELTCQQLIYIYFENSTFILSFHISYIIVIIAFTPSTQTLYGYIHLYVKVSANQNFDGGHFENSKLQLSQELCNMSTLSVWFLT